jgi:hypothetical protein
MSQLSHSLDSSLLVRDVAGDYRPANADEVLQTARRVLAGQMRGCEALTSPQVVRDFLRVKLGALTASIRHDRFRFLPRLHTAIMSASATSCADISAFIEQPRRRFIISVKQQHQSDCRIAPVPG